MATLAGALVLWGCVDLPDVTEGICGNGVIEPGEDCEASTLDGDTVVELCGDAAGDNACFFTWSAEVACPEGYGEGADGRCRQATGKFDPGGTLRLVVDDLEIGDVDGDLFDDVVTASGTSVQVSFGSTQADLASSVVTQVSTSGSGLEVGDVDGDGFDDVLIATAPGIQTFLGAADRALDPFSYPQVSFPGSASFVLGYSVDLTPGSPEEEVLTIMRNLIGFPVVIGQLPQLITLPAAPLGVDPGDQAGRLVAPAIGRLAESRTVVNDVDNTLEIALGYVGTQTISIYAASHSPIAITDTAVSLDAGALLRSGSGLFFGHFDGDGCRDLIANVGLTTSRLVVFRGTPSALDCTGALRPAINLLDFDDDTSLRVLAVEDFDGDGISDLVTTRGVYRVTGTGPSPYVMWAVTPVSTVTEPYLDAVSVDINGDGALDVAAFRESLPDVEVLINATTAGVPVFNRFVVPTGDAVLRLAAGDFDGDLTDDVAIVETDSQTGGLTVSVSFGAFHGPPSGRVVMDRFPALVGFLAASVVGSDGEPDAVDELIIAESDSVDDQIDITILFGSGARAMTAPLVLADLDIMQPAQESPVALVVGGFEGETALDLFTVGFGENASASAYLFEGDGTGGLNQKEREDWPRTFDSSDAVWAAGDVDGDGLDEIAAGESQSRRLEPGPSTLLLFPPHPEMVGDPVLGEVTGKLGVHAMAFSDLDADGDLDLLIAFDAKPTDLEDETILVAWNSGGELAEPRALPGSAGCIDAVPLQLDTDTGPELIALCRTSAVATVQFDLRRFDAVEPETLVATADPVVRVPGARTTRLRVGDIDGDGLDDVIVSTRGGEAADVGILLQHDVHDQD